MIKRSPEWQTWQWPSSHGFTLRGQHTIPRGLPVLHFIHGNSYSGLTYLPLWQQLYPHFDIFLHDVQGHGDSDNGARFVGWNRSAQLAVEVWQNIGQAAFGAATAYGCGHSFGGITTLMMSREAPSIFSQLVLLDPILFPRRMLQPMRILEALGLYRFNPYSRRALKRRYCWDSADEAMQSLANRGMFKGWQTDALEAYIQHALEKDENGHWRLKCPPRREAELFATYARGLWPHLRANSIPVHVFMGTQTYPFAQHAARRWQSCNPAMNLHWLPGGHCFMQEDPVQTARQIRAVLE